MPPVAIVLVDMLLVVVSLLLNLAHPVNLNCARVLTLIPEKSLGCKRMVKTKRVELLGWSMQPSNISKLREFS